MSPSPPSETLEATLRLAMVVGVGPRLRRVLLDRFGTSEKVLRAAPSALRELPGVGSTLCRRILDAERDIDAAEELSFCRQHGIDVLSESDDAYPAMLRQIHDPPAVLFLRGKLEPRDMVSIAIVGTRHATNYGIRQAERLAAGLSRAGFTIVSGLARGIDAAAHRAALSAGGRTLAVLGGGIHQIYPPEHAPLSDEIATSGAVLSEVPPRVPPKSGLFPQRNRIISGLTLGTIVVEAALRSGALITSTHAMEQGREVFAVPGPVDLRTSQGCHRLIRDGATLVENVEDVLEQLGPLIQPTSHEQGQEIRRPSELLLNDQKIVLEAIHSDPILLDDVAVASGLPINRVLSTITVLEVKHLIRRLSGNRVVRS